MPVLAIGGSKAWGSGEEIEQSPRRVATDVRGAAFTESGHSVPEERPDLLLEQLLQFFR